MDRRELIFTTARKVIVQNGLFDSSIGKIAKEANVPVGSVYTYYKSKEELINHIFIETKREMGAYIFQPIGKDLSGKDELKIYWERAVAFGLANEEKFLFAEQFSNSPLIQVSNKEEVKQSFLPVFKLLEDGISKQNIKAIDLFVLHNIIYNNIVGTIKYFTSSNAKLSAELKSQLFDCCWDSIKK